VTPFAVTLKTDAVPRRSRARRYSPEHTKFVRNHIEMLVRRGCLKWNPHSKWSSPVMIFPKPGRPGEFRMVVDCRYINSQVILIAGYLPSHSSTSGKYILVWKSECFQRIVAVFVCCILSRDLLTDDRHGHMKSHKAHPRGNRQRTCISEWHDGSLHRSRIREDPDLDR